MLGFRSGWRVTRRPPEQLVSCQSGNDANHETGGDAMNTHALRRSILMLAAVGALAAVSTSAAPLDPAALTYKLPDQLHWVANKEGALTATVYGDVSKSGLYVIIVKWPPHHWSHPHFHPHDRIVTVLSGTWWVGTGRKFDPDGTVPLSPGTVVTHYGRQIHYDGAKDTEAVLEIVGMGPGTATPAEQPSH